MQVWISCLQKMLNWKITLFQDLILQYEKMGHCLVLYRFRSSLRPTLINADAKQIDIIFADKVRYSLSTRVVIIRQTKMSFISHNFFILYYVHQWFIVTLAKETRLFVGSLLACFEATSIFWGSWGTVKNLAWLKNKAIKPPKIFWHAR